jgi:hypothetical protein
VRKEKGKERREIVPVFYKNSQKTSEPHDETSKASASFIGLVYKLTNPHKKE